MSKYSKLLSLVIIIAGVIVSCSKSDPAPSQASALIGNWKAVSYQRTGCTDPTYNESLTACTTSCETLSITATTVTVTVPGSAPMSFTYTVTGSTINITGSGAPTETITFVVSGTTLTINTQSPATGAEANCKGISIYTKI